MLNTKKLHKVAYFYMEYGLDTCMYKTLLK